MTKRITGRARQQRNARILAASTVCHLCGHNGADGVDHVTPIINGGTEDPANLRPAHDQAPCPTCRIRCNRVKGARDIAPIIRNSRAW